METYQELLKRHMSLPEVFDMIAKSSEFENISPRRAAARGCRHGWRISAAACDPGGGARAHAAARGVGG